MDAGDASGGDGARGAAGEPADGRFLLLRRALRNAGDHLIHERARRLVEAGHPGAVVDTADAWRPLVTQLAPERLRAYRAVIIGGGPGYAHGMPSTYPIGRLEDLPPVVALALGSYVVPGTPGQLAGYRFDGEDRAFLDAVLARSRYLGARDPVTARVLEANGYDRVLMTGDPAWYDLAVIDRDVIIPPAIRTIALTPPANPAYFRQALRLFEALADARRDATIEVIHHRGVQAPFRRLAERRGWADREISGSGAGFERYDRVDLHVGYRVHAHLYATSRGILSYLLAEDSRGTGMIEGLGGLGVPAFAPDTGRLELAALRHLPRWANPTRPVLRQLGPVAGRALRFPDLAPDLVARLEADEAAGFPEHRAARERIRAALEVMRRQVASLP